ncbi:dynein regulatory complex subunit 3 isoform X1 [Hypanus sabinus]|uniref:dynein regulatory complex subunit 3 isoform X1 n=2 Tax=Hypanus sabinus TaxID=79690 RepID=UPI0028C4B271|nr:dynein regulatory complex subunit 3 isoform X1 [Hypanus sabinus]XP_059835821.1 dynein regulatory complex subunit 3 isoform X1 [Hypanus sabinus]
MSQPYKTIEPNVIDDKMLEEMVKKQGPQGRAGRIAQSEGIDFKDVYHLQLDYQNVLKIDNLWQFTSLTKLQLDNNVIEKIEGLNTLVNLVWLDLSFNNIEMIEGLEELVKLEDLSLYCNRISKFENMDSLVNLQIFSIGKNHISDLESIIYLRRFKRLRTLNLAGNPVSEDERYSMYIPAFLPDLMYLDFRLIDKTTKEQALQMHYSAIANLVHQEDLEFKSLEKLRLEEEELALHKDAYVEYLNGPGLFDSMYAEDVEAPKLLLLPGVSEFVEQYKIEFTEICQKLFKYGLEAFNTRNKEVDCFLECLQEANEENQQNGIKIIKEFEDKNKEQLNELQHITDSLLVENKIHQLRVKIDKLWNSLMNLEMQLVDQLEEASKEFERNISEMVTTYIENVQALIAQCRDMENRNHENMLEIAMSSYDKMGKSDGDEEMPEELRALFIDKDTVMNTINASHDLHLLKIDNQEDKMVTKANAWLRDTIEKLHMDEIARNRKRILEINVYVNHWRDELDFLELQDV